MRFKKKNYVTSCTQKTAISMATNMEQKNGAYFAVL